MISPQQVFDEPQHWLSVPHDLHESLLKVMEIMFPGFQEKLKAAKIHCLRCEGQKPFQAYSIPEKKFQMVTGYIGDPGSPELYSCKDL